MRSSPGSATTSSGVCRGRLPLLEAREFRLSLGGGIGDGADMVVMCKVKPGERLRSPVSRGSCAALLSNSGRDGRSAGTGRRRLATRRQSIIAVECQALGLYINNKGRLEWRHASQ